MQMPGATESVEAEGNQVAQTGSTAREFQARSFSHELGGDAEKPVQIQLTWWERFLAGEVVCPCFSFWLFLAAMLLLTAGGLAGGFKIMETSGDVLSDDTVQLYYAQKYLQEKGCTAGEVFDSPVCHPGWAVADATATDRPTSPRERVWAGDAVLLMYEATGTDCPGDDCDAASSNLLTPRNLRAMKAFEDALWGARDFQDDHCLLRYPAFGNATPVCNPPVSMLNQLYSGTEAAVTATKELFDTGFGSVFGQCMCSTVAEEPCAACASAATKSEVVDCIMGAPPSSLAFVPEGFRTDEAALRSYLGAAVEQTCADLGNSSCQYAAPYLSSVCSTTAWSHTLHGSREPLEGEALNRLLARVCDPSDTALSPLRRNTLPSFACEGSHLTRHGTPFLMSIYMTGHNGDDKEALEEEYASKLWRTYQDALKQARQDTDGEMRPMMLSGFTALKSMESLLIHDAALAVGSFLVVLLYMWFTTETFFLSSMGMLQVLFSCPPAFLVWKIYSPDGISHLQFLCVYMILGIGADDVFVLLDAWKQARVALGSRGTPAQVFALAYRRAFSAMLTTTSTTGAAFLFGSFSPIPAVSSFCMFACMVVCFDFLWCITFFASSLCVYERFFMGRSCCCVGDPKPAGSCGGPGCCWGGVRALYTRTPWGKGAERRDVDERAMERFCAGPLFHFVRRHKYALCAFWLLAAAAAGVVAGTMLKTATKPAEIGDEGNDLVRLATIVRDYFTVQEQQVVQVFWGLPAEGAVSKYTSKNPITPQVALLGDGAEALTTPEGQRAALELCRSADAQGARCESDACLVYGSPSRCERDSAVWGHRRVDVPHDPFCATGRYCFVEWVAEYVEAHLNGSFPVPQAEFVPLLQSEGFRDYLAAREAANSEAGRHWDNTLGHEQTGWIIEDGGLAFAWMTFNATFTSRAPKDVSNEWHERWEDHVSARAGASAPRQSSQMYVFMVLQNALLQAAIQGMLVSLAVTAVILALVTFNWVLALIGLLNIGFITVIFLGVMPLIPWELGESECIFLIAVVGLAVDYTVHLLHAYNEHEGSREERMQAALSTMGISVASGAITTMGAGLMLFLCDLAFFQQYGAFIFLVILISLVLALTSLPPLILILGPEGESGRIVPLYWIRCQLSKVRGGQARQGQERE